MSLNIFLSFWLSLSPLILLANFASGEKQCSEIKQFLESVSTTESKFNSDSIENLCNTFIALDCGDKILAYNLLGYIKYNDLKLIEAKKLLLKGEGFYLKEKSNEKYYSINQNYLALVEIIEKDFDSALVHLNKSKELAISINDNRLLAFATLNLGLLYLEKGELRKSEDFLNETLTINTNIAEYRGYAYQNLARIFLKQKRAFEALKMAEASKEIWLNLDHKKGLYFISLLQAEILQSIKLYDEALEVLTKGRKIGKQAGIALLMGENYKAEAYLHLLKNNLSGEKEALKQALVFHKELSFEAIENCATRLYEISKPENFEEIMDALLSIIKNSKKNNVENTKRQLTKEVRLEKEIDDIAEISRKQLVAMSGLLIFILLVISFLFRIFMQNRQIKVLNEALLNSKQKIEAQMNLLEIRNEDLKNFAYVASHDLQSPLKTIGSFTNLIEKKLNGQAEKVKPYINYVKSATDNMSKMIADLLNHAQTESSLNLEPISFSKIIDAALHNLKADIEKSEAKILLNTIAGDIIFCDKIKMIGTVQNIIINAINYSKPNQQPTIKISTSNDNNFFILSIKDDGIGIDHQYHSKIFEMFNRLNDKKNIDGTGIGLATCLKNIQLHNGNITVISNPDEGSEFIIKLPIMIDEIVRY